MPVQPKGVVLLRSGTSGIPDGLPISMLGHSLIMRAGCVHRQAALASSGRYFAALATRILDSNLLESPFRPADADSNLSVKLGDSFEVAITGGDSGDEADPEAARSHLHGAVWAGIRRR